MAYFALPLVGASLSGCPPRYEQNSHGQVETAEAEQIKMSSLESQLKDQGLEMERPSQWHQALSQLSKEDLTSAAEKLKEYLSLSADVERLAQVQGVHSVDTRQASMRTKTAKRLLDQVHAELDDREH